MTRMSGWSSCNPYLEDKWHSMEMKAHRARLESIQSSIPGAKKPSTAGPHASIIKVQHTLSPTKSSSKSSKVYSHIDIEQESIVIAKKLAALQQQQQQQQQQQLKHQQPPLTQQETHVKKMQVKKISKPIIPVMGPIDITPGTTTANTRLLHTSAGTRPSVDTFTFTTSSSTCALASPPPTVDPPQEDPVQQGISSVSPRKNPAMKTFDYGNFLSNAFAHTRYRSQRKIMDENKKFVQRLLSTKTTFDRQELQKREEKRLRLLKNMSRNRPKSVGSHTVGKIISPSTTTSSSPSAKIITHPIQATMLVVPVIRPQTSHSTSRVLPSVTITHRKSPRTHGGGLGLFLDDALVPDLSQLTITRWMNEEKNQAAIEYEERIDQEDNYEEGEEPEQQEEEEETEEELSSSSNNNNNHNNHTL